MKIITKKYIPFLYLLLLTLIVHGLALFNNGVFWDGTIIQGFQQSNNIVQLHNWFFSSGVPLNYYIHRLLWLFNSVFIYNFVGVVSIFLIASFIYKSAKEFEFINKEVAIILGSFVIVFPGCQLTSFRIMMPSYIYLSLFFIAFYLGLRSERINKKWQCILYRISSIIFFIVSFSLASLLVYYLLFIICLYLVYCNHKRIAIFNIRESLPFLFKKIDFLLIPFLFWSIKNTFFKTRGVYAASNYNTISFQGISAFIHHYHSSLNNSIFRHFHNLYHFWSYNKLLLIGIIIIVSICFFLRLRPRDKNTLISVDIKFKLGYMGLIIFGILAVLLALFPYIIVGKFYTVILAHNFPASRFIILIPFSMALFLAGIIGFFFTKKGKISFIGIILSTILIIGFIPFWWNSYLILSAKSAVQKSFISILRQHPNWSDYSIYWIDVSQTQSYIQPYKSIYAWGYSLNEAYQGHSRVGFPYLGGVGESISKKYSEYYHKELNTLKHSQYQRERYNMGKLNPYGKQIRLRLKSTYYNNSNATHLGILYIYYRITNKTKLNTLLRNLITIKGYPINQLGK